MHRLWSPTSVVDVSYTTVFRTPGSTGRRGGNIACAVLAYVTQDEKSRQAIILAALIVRVPLRVYLSSKVIDPISF